MSTYRLPRGYAYGHDGNRAIKMTGNASIDQSGMLLNSTNLENITIYPNEYLTVTQAEYTKYYYAGGNRIASKIGTGGFEKMTRLCTLDQGPTYNANTLLNFVLYQVTNTTQPPTDEYPVDVCAGYSVATELLTNPLPDFYISQTNLNFTQNNLLQQFRQNLAGGTEPVYYFHSDHLGSASWITNGSGLPVQHLLYLPFGEHFANEHSSGYDERFTFTGKERDAETGYYYFGARFDNVDLGFMSVDPMTDKYPSISPYAYCAWNPVKLVDPEGEEIDESTVTKEIRNLIKNNKEFEKVYNQLKNDKTTIFKFNQMSQRDQNGATGSIKLEEICEKHDIVNINYGWDIEKEYGQPAERTLCEEVYHAKQFLDGCIGLGLSDDGEHFMLGYDVHDEKEAMDWAGKILNAESIWNDKNVSGYYKLKCNADRKKRTAEQDFIGKNMGVLDYDKNGRMNMYRNSDGISFTFRKPKN